VFGAACEPCADDGYPACLALAGLAWTGARTDEPTGAELPLCGADFTQAEVPEIELGCDFTGLTCAGGWAFLLVPFARRRRPPPRAG
jgi:hypothetical protein